MRYYSFKILTNSQRLEEADLKGFLKRTTVESYYYGPLEGVNRYMYRYLKNDMTFFAYREDGNCTFACFSFNEKTISLDDAYECIVGMLKDILCKNNIATPPHEITMFEFLNNLDECSRRGIMGGPKGNIADIAARGLWQDYLGSPREVLERSYFDFKEKIIPTGTVKKLSIYDKGFVEELNNIENHKNLSGDSVNMVHYIISARSVEATLDMTVALVQTLYDAKRISSRRVEVISAIKPEFYSKNNYLENIIEYNLGGAIIIDLTEAFDKDPAQYVMASKYIEKVFKTYRNKCLFVFTYNIDSPGFSYQLLPSLRKYAITLTLKEGSGNRKTAVNYMKQLIKNSDYAEYAEQAAEFMEGFPGNDFSQTDVLAAYEQFEPWCINKNMFKAYNYDLSKDFMLDRDENCVSNYDKLHQMIGLNKIKKQIDEIIAENIVEKERKKRCGKDYQMGTMHMVFGGNPGSAKTTVARLFAGIAKEKGILKSGIFVEKGGMDLNGCIREIREAFVEAKGGVLFIDEAYSLWFSGSIATLIQEMENHRDDVIVVLAGYNDEMKEFLKRNAGLKSRIPYWIDFPDYSTDELVEIFKFMLDERGFSIFEDGIQEAKYDFDKARSVDDFGNGRYVRNLVERAIKNQSLRLMENKKSAEDISKKDLFLLTKSDIVRSAEGSDKKERKSGTAKKELQELIGLKSVKEVINKALASYKMNKLCLEKGMKRGKASMHMVFTGNPGTAKTTVARLFAEILKDEKVLPTGKFVEVGRSDLVGSFVGTTAKIVKHKFREAKGGVLFIDEAYALCDGYESGFGDEAINTIVQEMENNREDTIVIFAGYPGPMKEFLDRNPGMRSRIAFNVNFDDYSVDELCDITRLMVKNKGMTITNKAMKKLKGIYESVQGESDYGNGRYVRKLLEEAEMNLAARLLDMDTDVITEKLLGTIEICDIPEAPQKKKEKKAKIGFAKEIA